MATRSSRSIASKAPNRQTLRAWLTQPDPVLKLAILYKSAADEKQMKPWPEVPGWKRWTDFSLKTIEDSLGFLLDTEFDFPPFLTDLPQIHRKIRYAYILTPMELLVYRRGRPTAQGIVPEVQSIAWSTEPDPKKLTIPLALFGMQVFASLDHKARIKYVRMPKEYQNALEAVRVGMKKAGL
ncbi:hypothetical protein SLS54_008927 [Diplodia seriata]